MDAGQVYRSLLWETVANPNQKTPSDPATIQVPPTFLPLRITPGVGLIFKLGFPLKVEYAADWKRIMGQPRSAAEQESQLKSLLISAGFQF